MLSAVTGRGVTELLRATIAPIEARRKEEKPEGRAESTQWAPPI